MQATQSSRIIGANSEKCAGIGDSLRDYSPAAPIAAMQLTEDHGACPSRWAQVVPRASPEFPLCRDAHKMLCDRQTRQTTPEFG